MAKETKKKVVENPVERKEPPTPEEWGERYKLVRNNYEAYTEELLKLIKTLLKARNIEVAQVECRTKSVKRFVEKIQGKGKKYNDPLKDIMDLSGIRVITYYKEDVDEVVEMLKKEFIIDWKNSVNKTRLLAPDQFGYQSDHYIVSLSSARRDLSEWKSFKELKAEIQVRSALQHVWAERDHKLRYETPKEAPLELGRRLFRLSAVLELADAEFSSIRELKRNLGEEYSHGVTKGEFDISLNLDSLETYLNLKKQKAAWTEIAQKVGFFVDDHLFPERFEEYRRRLLGILNSLGVKTIGELDSLLEIVLSAGMKMLAQCSRAVKKEHATVGFGSYSILMIVALIAKKSQITDDVMALTGFFPELRKTIKNCILES